MGSGFGFFGRFGILIGAVLAIVVVPATGLRAQEAMPDLRAYGALPAIESVDLSPDGTSLVYVRHDGDASEVVARTRAGDVLVVVDTSDRRVRGVSWISPDHIVISSASTEKIAFFSSRAEVQVLDIVNVRTQRVVRALNSSDQRSFNAIFNWRAGVFGGKPVLFAEAVTESPGLYTFDLYRIDAETGRGRRHAQGDSDTRAFLVGREGSVPARLAYNPENGRWRVSSRSGGGWRDIHAVGALLDQPGFYGFGRSLNTVSIGEEVDGQWRMTEISLSDGSEQHRSDLGPNPNRIYKNAAGAVIGVGFMETYQDYEFFEPALAEAWTLLKATLPGRQLFLSSYSDDFAVIVFYMEGSGEPGSYFLYDAAAKRLSLVGKAYPAISGEQVAEVRIVNYQAADGMELFGYLTLPPGREARNLPLIALPHGGPASRDTAGFDYWAQALASRGYAVFQPQFRGSSGLGTDLLEAGYGQWGRKMQSDVSDGVRFLAERGTIDAARVCVAGASYGGYVALAGMALEPGTYRCAVSVAGVSDLRAMLAEEERQGARGDANPAIRYWRRFMGADGVGDTRLDALSPARNAAAVQGPILLIHGRNDTVVPFAQSELMVRAMGAAPARLVALEGEDHFLSTAATRQQMLSETVQFLEANNPPR